MKLLIHDLNESEWSKVAAEYEGWKVISDNGSIKPCAGCFGCWFKNPGQCVIKDGYDQMGNLIHEAKEVVVISKYTYGGFSSFIKTVFDRSIGYILPYFRFYKGEMHHKTRYRESKPMTFVFRGVGLTDQDKEKATQYVKAVVTNFNGKLKEIRFVECDEIAKNAETVPVNTETDVIPGKTVFLNCSLRGEEANSKKFLDVLADNVEGEKENINLMAYSTKLDELADILMTAEKIVFGMPLYVDGVPSTVLRIMEKLEAKGVSNKKIYAVANMGFYESKQIRNLLSMMKTWCDECGIEYGGGIAIGAGGMLGNLIHYGSHGPGKNAYDNLCTLGEAVNSSNSVADLYVDAYKFPRIAYFFTANSIMRNSVKKNK
jgi:multimeric flavodoxin WrbA